jgi:hypothetical protein
MGVATVSAKSTKTKLDPQTTMTAARIKKYKVFPFSAGGSEFWDMWWKVLES